MTETDQRLNQFQNINHVSKVLKQSRRDGPRAEPTRGSFGVTQGKCGKICIGSEFPRGGKIDRKTNAVLMGCCKALKP